MERKAILVKGIGHRRHSLRSQLKTIFFKVSFWNLKNVSSKQG